MPDDVAAGVRLRLVVRPPAAPQIREGAVGAVGTHRDVRAIDRLVGIPRRSHHRRRPQFRGVGKLVRPADAGQAADPADLDGAGIEPGFPLRPRHVAHHGCLAVNSAAEPPYRCREGSVHVVGDAGREAQQRHRRPSRAVSGTETAAAGPGRSQSLHATHPARVPLRARRHRHSPTGSTRTPAFPVSARSAGTCRERPHPPRRPTPTDRTRTTTGRNPVSIGRLAPGRRNARQHLRNAMRRRTDGAVAPC
jgi:hypothetical protein